MDFLTYLYSATGIMFGLAFLPQIRSLLRDTSGAAAISIQSWLMFTFVSLVALCYAVVNVGDVYFIGTSAIGAAGNSAVLSLALLRRYRSRGVLACALASK